MTNKKKQLTARTNPRQVFISNSSDFAVFTRKPHPDQGTQWLVTSFEMTPQLADRLEKSQIIEVESFSADGMLIYSRRAFYSNNKMVDLVIDLIEFKQSQNGRESQAATIPALNILPVAKR